MGEIVHKMMARLPADRYQHAREITQDLKRVARILKDEHTDGGRADADEASSEVRRPVRAGRAIGGKRSSNGRPQRHAIMLAVAAVVVAVRLGGARLVAAPGRSAGGSRHADKIRSPSSRTAKEQFERARNGLQSDEEAWRAVLQYFPDDRTYTPEAKERLAVLYLKTRRLDEAKKLFDDLESMGRENPNAQAAGIAGNAVVASLQKNYLESQRLIVDGLRDLPHVREQITGDLWYLLQHAGRENAQQLGDRSQQAAQRAV